MKTTQFALMSLISAALLNASFEWAESEGQLCSLCLAPWMTLRDTSDLQLGFGGPDATTIFRKYVAAEFWRPSIKTPFLIF